MVKDRPNIYLLTEVTVLTVSAIAVVVLGPFLRTWLF